MGGVAIRRTGCDHKIRLQVAQAPPYRSDQPATSRIQVVAARNRDGRLDEIEQEARDFTGPGELRPPALMLVRAPEPTREVVHSPTGGAKGQQRAASRDQLVVGMRRDHEDRLW